MGMTRRDLLNVMGAGFGMVGLRGIAGAEMAADPLAPKAPHFPARAKRVIYLFLNGGPSQVDTFDPKPKLTEYHGKPLPAGNLQKRAQDGQPRSARRSPSRSTGRAASKSARFSRSWRNPRTICA